MPPLKQQKREKFCLEYFKSGNAASAAVLAGYSVKSIRSIASQLLTNINIKTRLAELQERAASAKIATVTERKEILTEILRTRLTDFMELGKDGSWVNIGPETTNGRAIQEIHSRTEYDDNGEHPTIYTSVKLHSPIEAIKELNKMERIYDDSAKVNVNLDQRQITFQIVNIETQNNLTRIQNGERTEPLEINNNIQSERRGISEQDKAPGTE